MTVSRAGFALGFAGLLPPLACLGAVLSGEAAASVVALVYALLILSFLGGMWWGFAVQRPGEQQAPLVLAAVVPSLVAFAFSIAAALFAVPHWALIATGSAVLLTLPVDRHLVATGDAPQNWMRLRVPLSVGLGLSSIATGAALALY